MLLTGGSEFSVSDEMIIQQVFKLFELKKCLIHKCQTLSIDISAELLLRDFNLIPQVSWSPVVGGVALNGPGLFCGLVPPAAQIMTRGCIAAGSLETNGSGCALVLLMTHREITNGGRSNEARCAGPQQD